MEAINIISGFFIHLFGLFDLGVVVLNNGLHIFLRVANVLLHLLSAVHYLLLAVLGVVDLPLILCFLNLVLGLRLLECPQQSLCPLSDFGLARAD